MKRLREIRYLIGPFLAVFLGHSANAAEKAIIVPISPSTLHVSLDLTDTRPEAERGWEVVDDGGTRVPVQLVPAIAPDGTAKGLWLVADIPAAGNTAGPRRLRLEPLKEHRQAAFVLNDLNDKSLRVSDA